jgi:hypothetical protein
MLGEVISMKNALQGVGNLLDSEYEPTLKDTSLFMTKGSLIKLLKPFIIEPVFIVSNTVKNNSDVDTNLIKTNLNIFTAFYVKAFEVLTNYYGYTAQISIELLASNRTTSVKNLNKSIFGKKGLTFENFNETFIDVLNSSTILEAEATDDAEIEAEEREKKRIKERDEVRSAVDFKIKRSGKSDVGDFAKDIPKTMYREATITFDVSKNTESGAAFKTISLPIIIKANIIYTDDKNILNMLQVKDKNKSFLSRYLDLQIGAVSLYDFIFAGDLIKEYKKHKINDHDDLIGHMRKRSIGSDFQLIKSGAQGFQKMYGVLIVGKNLKKSMDASAGGDINRRGNHNKIHESLQSLLINVVDTDYETVDVYTHELDGKSTMSFKELKKAGKKKEEDLTELYKTMFMNNQRSMFS